VRSGEPGLKYGPSVRPGVGRPEQVEVPWPVSDAGVADVADGGDAVRAGGGAEADDDPAGPPQAPRTIAASSPRAALAAAL
jgi:hypothetical protein